jgi:hypothetical protein
MIQMRFLDVFLKKTPSPFSFEKAEGISITSIYLTTSIMVAIKTVRIVYDIVYDGGDDGGNDDGGNDDGGNDDQSPLRSILQSPLRIHFFSYDHLLTSESTTLYVRDLKLIELKPIFI